MCEKWVWAIVTHDPPGPDSGWYIARDVEIHDALKKVSFVLDQVEKYGLLEDYTMGIEIGYHLVIEEVLGALVAAEQELKSIS